MRFALVIGIGTSEISPDRFSQKIRYVGITTVFRGDGNYLLSHVSKDCTYDERRGELGRATKPPSCRNTRAHNL